jgi:hypothetical protein
MKKDDYIQEIRGAQSQEEVLTKRWGMYSTKDVDQYVEKLQLRMRNAEAVYHERHEEMRTNLLGITRERDSQAEKIHKLEQQLANYQDIDSYLQGQGKIAIPIETYEELQAAAAPNPELDKLAQENKRLLEDQSHFQQDLLNLESTQQKLAEVTLANDKAASQLQVEREKSMKLEQQLLELSQRGSRQEVRLEVLKLTVEEQTEYSNRTHAQYQALTVQHKVAQEMVQQLIKDKDNLEKESIIQQQRWDLRRTSLVNRYQALLNSQHACMKQFEESFAATLQCMESLAEPGLRGFQAVEAER